MTQLLRAWGRGDAEAAEELLPILYRELRQIARRLLAGERPGHTLQPTALVNEAFLRFAGPRRENWANREHFLAVAAQVMRRILVDHARRRRTGKRGQDWQRVTFDERLWDQLRNVDVVHLDEALTALSAMDARQARIVELRVFGGLTAEETAGALNVSPATIQRDWRMARAWLRRELTR